MSKNEVAVRTIPIPDYSAEAIEGELFTIKGIHGDHSMNINSKTHKADYEALQVRLSLGRYTLEEAALFVCEQQTGEHSGNAKKILEMLMDGARAGTLQIYNPDSRCPRSKKDAQQVWHAIEEAYWSDLNEWIRVNAKFLDCKFPKPDAPAAKVANGGVRLSVTGQQNDAILNWLKSNKHDPLKLPVPSSGKAGVKKLCRDELCTTFKQLFSSSSVFNTAWERLRFDGAIKDEE